MNKIKEKIALYYDIFKLKVKIIGRYFIEIGLYIAMFALFLAFALFGIITKKVE